MSGSGLGQAASLLLTVGVLLGLWRAMRSSGAMAGRVALWHGLVAVGGICQAGGALAFAPVAPGVIVWEGFALGVAAAMLGVALWRLRLGATQGIVLLLHAVFGGTGAVLVVGWAIG